MNPTAHGILASNIIPLPRHGLLAQDLINSGGEPMAHLMAQLDKIYGAGRRWGMGELYGVLELSRIPSCKEECQAIIAYYNKLSNKQMFAHSPESLLEKWTGYVAKANIAARPKGHCKDPIEINRRKMEARMMFLKARATCPDSHQWLEDSQSRSDRSEFNQIKEML